MTKNLYPDRTHTSASQHSEPCLEQCACVLCKLQYNAVWKNVVVPPVVMPKPMTTFVAGSGIVA